MSAKKEKNELSKQNAAAVCINCDSMLMCDCVDECVFINTLVFNIRLHKCMCVGENKLGFD